MFRIGYKEYNVDVEIQMSVLGKYKDTENVHFKTLESVTVATAIVNGCYNLLTDANQEIIKWIVANNYEFAGTSFSIYHVSPAEEKDPKKFATEICCPIKYKQINK